MKNIRVQFGLVILYFLFDLLPTRLVNKLGIKWDLRVIFSLKNVHFKNIKWNKVGCIDKKYVK